MGKCYFVRCFISYSGYLALLVGTIFLFSRHIHKLRQDNFTQWENAWKYWGIIDTCIVLSSFGIIVILIRILTILCCRKKGPTVMIVLLVIYSSGSFFSTIGVAIAAISVTCNLSDESHRKTCQSFFSWGIASAGIGIQFAASVVMPLFLAICVETHGLPDEDDDTGNASGDHPSSVETSSPPRQPVTQDPEVVYEEIRQPATRIPPYTRPAPPPPDETERYTRVSPTAPPIERTDSQRIDREVIYDVVQRIVRRYLSRERGAGNEIGLNQVGRPQCIVCLDREVEVVIMPCGHANLCQECVDSVKSSDNKCPTCRGDITSVNRCYV